MECNLSKLISNARCFSASERASSISRKRRELRASASARCSSREAPAYLGAFRFAKQFRFVHPWFDQTFSRAQAPPEPHGTAQPSFLVRAQSMNFAPRSQIAERIGTLPKIQSWWAYTLRRENFRSITNAGWNRKNDWVEPNPRWEPRIEGLGEVLPAASVLGWLLRWQRCLCHDEETGIVNRSDAEWQSTFERQLLCMS